jgi:hypothetical protein
MPVAKVKTKSAPTVQDVCIDLPGETVQCWRSSDNIKVILRKHRDIIFELKLERGRSYTVESSGSDFYNANEKKLIAGRNAGRIAFKDGDRLHLWTARDFNGELLLKSAGKLMLRLEPAKLDTRQYDDEPKTKPTPIIITLGDPAKPSNVQEPKAAQRLNIPQATNHSQIARPVAAPLDEECKLVCVMDGELKGMPAQVWKSLKKGGGETGLADLDPNDIATRNWLLGQFAGATAYLGDNWDWLRSSMDGKTHKGFKLVKATIHRVKGKARFYFSGYSRYNQVFGPGGFGPGHDRIMSIFGGAGKVNSVLKSTATGLAGTFKGNALVSFVFGSAAALAEWKDDISKDGYDLVASLLTSAVKSLFSAAVTVAIVACLVVLIMFIFGASLSVIAVGALTLGVGVAVNYGTDVLDKKLGRMVMGESHQDGLSAVLAEHMRQSVQYHWDYLKKKMLWSYEEAPF